MKIKEPFVQKEPFVKKVLLKRNRNAKVREIFQIPFCKMRFAAAVCKTTNNYLSSVPSYIRLSQIVLHRRIDFAPALQVRINFASI